MESILFFTFFEVIFICLNFNTFKSKSLAPAVKEPTDLLIKTIFEL